MKWLLALNSFKNSLSAIDAIQALAKGLRKAGVNEEDILLFPVADGGDDTTRSLQFHLGGKMIPTPCHDPLQRPIRASFLWIANRQMAVVEMASASGLRLLDPTERQPLHAHTYGTGELVAAVLRRKPSELLIGVGGSATIDGGAGLLRALGARFLDSNGHELHDFPLQLTRLHRIDDSPLIPLRNRTRWKVLCDVNIPLMGKQGTVQRYGAQKGATTSMMAQLEDALHRLAEVTRRQTGIALQRLPQAGAAGGVAGALHAWLGAELLPGAETFLEYTHFLQVLPSAQIVITGEGKIDHQTLDGKAPLIVARHAKANHIPVVALAGEIPVDISHSLQQHFDALFSITNGPNDLQHHLSLTRSHLQRMGMQLARLLLSGISR
ncbi:MAG: glycerate kinase [Thermoflavifilum sp.]|nr:glycerate kinase [Thermoflavifilum sp.]